MDAKHVHYIAVARDAVSEEGWSSLWDEGHAMTLDQMTAYALDEGAHA
jgi:hypothetical protein